MKSEIELIELIMEMVNESFTHNRDGTLSHDSSSTKEWAIETLIGRGYAREIGKNRYKLDWDKLKARG